MNERKAVSTEKPVAGGNSSRTIVIVVVVALIVIAVGGIVLAGRNSGETAPVTQASAPPSSAPAVAAAAVVAPASQGGSAPAATTPDEVIFLPGSDKFPPGANEKIADVVQRAKAGGKTVRVTVRYLTGANKARDLELAKSRATALRHAVMADGITGDKMQMELVEMPEGSLQPADAQRAVFSLR